MDELPFFSECVCVCVWYYYRLLRSTIIHFKIWRNLYVNIEQYLWKKQNKKKNYKHTHTWWIFIGSHCFVCWEMMLKCAILDMYMRRIQANFIFSLFHLFWIDRVDGNHIIGPMDFFFSSIVILFLSRSVVYWIKCVKAGCFTFNKMWEMKTKQ